MSEKVCPFKVIFGEGQSLWPCNWINSTPISGVIGVGVEGNMQSVYAKFVERFFL
ncbi:MAG: hypothetical protein HFG83_08855 [Dorea sp.]|jgi:hypothetical protein|nr:hypothetical protein [Dorea sp.]MCI9453921.1 hypothetical protein [Dorea sp.]